MFITAALDIIIGPLSVDEVLIESLSFLIFPYYLAGFELVSIIKEALEDI